jgi:hypothetical protein
MDREQLWPQKIDMSLICHWEEELFESNQIKTKQQHKCVKYALISRSLKIERMLIPSFFIRIHLANWVTLPELLGFYVH